MLGRIKSDDVRVDVVWVPSLPADDESKVPAATAKIPDERASHYWDEKGALVKAYGRVLRLGDGETAWDVYYVYGRDAEWGGEPPAPGFFMDQVGLPGGQPLDGDKLAAEMRRLLRQGK
ncbi:MAG TPA: hypothetical protein VF064_14855 [Pyrinomonadaceae bacterium]